MDNNEDKLNFVNQTIESAGEGIFELVFEFVLEVAGHLIGGNFDGL